MDIFTGSIDERLNAVNKLLNMESNFDIILRNLTIGNKKVVIFVINGFLNSDLCERITPTTYNTKQSKNDGDFGKFLYSSFQCWCKWNAT